MRILSLLCLSLIFGIKAPQSKLSPPPVEGVALNTPLANYEKSVYLITGKEDIYQKYDWLKESIQNNIKNGIREGIYQGNTLDIVDGNKASKMTLFFYKEALYKVRWSFSKSDYSDLKAASVKLDNYLTDKYGKITELGFYDMKIWRDEKVYLQSLGDADEYQIEYRDEKTHLIVEALN